ncbi:MAG: DUF2029 domain-containing protein [Rhodospirillales bacterium]|nr:DUF2029 domain-containing protein [Rhodospirillales bacterium]
MTGQLRSLVALGITLVLIIVVGLLLVVPDPSGTTRFVSLTALMVGSGAVYFAAVRLVLSRPTPRHALWVVLGVAVALRAVLLTEPPALSSDIYRYVWDGRVQAARINPYRHVPADPALADLRDTEVYPHINRADYALTIYPPVAQIVFAAVGWFGGGVLAMRLVMVAFEALAVACLLRLLSRAALPPDRILIYAWNPLVLWSFASDGHVDAIAIGLLGLALLLRARRDDGWAGVALAGAVLAKFLPLVVAPAFVRGGRFWRPAAAGLGVIVACYALYSSAGWQVLGFLPGYGQEEGLVSGTGIWLLSGLSLLTDLPRDAVPIYAACVAAGFAILSVMIMRRRMPADDVRALCRDVGVLAAVATAAASPHYHWYFAWLAVPAVVAPSRSLLWLATAPLLLIEQPVPSDRFWWPSLIYVPAIVLLAVDLRRGRALTLRHEAGNGETRWTLQQS